MHKLKSRVAVVAFLFAVVAAAATPFLGKADGAASAAVNNFDGWPTHYEGRALTELPLTQREVAFTRDFPGRIGRFSDGKREIIIRWVNAPTRRLHPAADCFRGSGYSTTPLPVSKDADGAAMGCFQARRGAHGLRVCEVIKSARGESWPDVSAWYWGAVFDASRAPWWSFVVAERS